MKKIDRRTKIRQEVNISKRSNLRLLRILEYEKKCIGRTVIEKIISLNQKKKKKIKEFLEL